MSNSEVADIDLPPLREDLKLLEGPESFDGSPTWTIFDPLRNKYFRIGWSAFQLLSRWTAGKASIIKDRINKETTCHITDDDISTLLHFLYANSLTAGSASGSNRDYLDQYKASKPNIFVWLIRNYLFFRIPLVRPDRFLKATFPFVEPLFTATARNLVLIIGLLGLYLAVREWDVFVHTFLYFFNVKGALLYFLALVFIKILHELGHAYTATRYGCNVPTMGVAFLVMFPVLYTDATDAWRLKSRRQRLYIGAAGILVELYIALIATFLWSFLPDGILRSAAFILATSSWILSIGININAFMRFDGYYILSDWLGIQNLQVRSFALGRWKLRQILFAVDEPVPERLPKSMQRNVIIYAWCVWLYRFFLFLTIAILVYYFFFKLLGIILFIIEIYWFIVLPIFREFDRWWAMRHKIILSPQFYLTSLILFSLVAAFIIPWSTNVKMPAIMEAEEKTIIFLPAPGVIKEIMVSEGDSVQENDILFILESPELSHEIKTTRKEIEIFELRARRSVANPEDLADIQIILQQLEELNSKLEGLYKEQQQLVIRAPASGVIVDLADSLHDNRWINETLPLAYIITPHTAVIRGMLSETELTRIHVAKKAVFIPDDPARGKINAWVKDIELANTRYLDIPYISSVYGGDIAVQMDDDNNPVPENSVYQVRLIMDEQLKNIPTSVIRGIVHIEGEARSFAKRIYDIGASVIIRESGF